MNSNSNNIDDKIFEDCNNKLLGIINDLQQLIKDKEEEDSLTKSINDIINKINTIITENKEHNESITKKISSLKEQLNLQNININNNKNKEKNM